MGYSQAGFEVIGVDIKHQPRYPFNFIHSDWNEALDYFSAECEKEGVQYAIHASPPCQRYSTMTKRWGKSEAHPDLVSAVREALKKVGVPYVIENVPGAPLIEPVILCGSMFGLEAKFEGRLYQVRRHRMFETSFQFSAPSTCVHKGQALPVYGNSGGSSKRDGLRFPDTPTWRIGMGINWMTGKELAEAIPPAYTEYVGNKLKEHMNA